MNDEYDAPGNGEDIETGEPIAELAALRETPSEGFGLRIRNSVQRRLFAAQTADFSLRVLLQTMFDYLTAAMDAFGGPSRDQNKGDDDG